MVTGLGLPWTIATIYYESKGDRYVTPAGNLSFSVMIFMVRDALLTMLHITNGIIIWSLLFGFGCIEA